MKLSERRKKKPQYVSPVQIERERQRRQRRLPSPKPPRPLDPVVALRKAWGISPESSCTER